MRCSRVEKSTNSIAGRDINSPSDFERHGQLDERLVSSGTNSRQKRNHESDMLYLLKSFVNDAENQIDESHTIHNRNCSRWQSASNRSDLIGRTRRRHSHSWYR